MAKFNIQNLNEISDGRELLETRPNRFTSIFIYILIAILVSFLLWAWFSTKEVVINVPGIVTSNDDTYAISTMLTGAVKSVNIKNGQYVKTGDVLFTLNTKNDKTQLDGLEKQEKDLSSNIIDLNSLIKAINGDSSFLSNENKYYSEYSSYLAQNNITNSEINTENSMITNVQNQINGLNNLVKSIQNNSNSVSNNSLYNAQYESYENSRQSLENKINSLNTQKNTLTNELNNERNLQSRLQTEQNNLNKEKKAVLKDENKNNTTSSTSNQTDKNTQKVNKEEQKIQDTTNQISNIEAQMQNDGSNTTLTNEINSINAEIQSTNSQIANLKNQTISQIESQIQTLNNQLNELQGNNSKTALNKPLTKYQLLSQINNTLNIDKSNDEQLKIKIKELKNILENGQVKANHNGVIYIPQVPTVGMVLQAGQQVGEILPNNDKFKVKLMIPNDEIGNVKKGDTVKYSFISFPYTEYGFLQGKLENINVTSELNPKTGLSYYEGSSTLTSNTISNKQGKTGEIKLGMACEVKIISRKEKMLYYILNQLGLKTNNI
ncbi:HlyD family efflux transporter periplasmic adaptor subunit [Paraclostridium bifermentans]|uniref:HlyD family efflux transporter periplasmic adaptor subunit n=1 Tax=Paraclostridium bifermentans TaxID=1490 RepID=UPI00242C61EB|nr:HlyD family efflux transporter periplasmic adaptor subunit [Paraclostridium bifermentans]